MAAELLLPTARASSTANVPYSGAKWYFYESETTTPLAVYADADLQTSLGAVVTSDSAGKFVPIYFDSSQLYRGVLKDATGAVTLHDIDPINPGVLSQLADSTGAASIGTVRPSAGAVERNLQDWINDSSQSVKDFGAVADYSLVSGTGTNDAPAFNAALSHQSTIGVGSFSIDIPHGRYAMSGTGDRILEIQDGTYARGSGALESIDLRVLDGSTALAVWEDDGSGAKIEARNIQTNGRDNTNLTAIWRLGVRGVQFGTYGYLDNLMARNAPNATAYELDVNIQAMGDLYSISTKDGVVTTDGSIGAHFKGIYPISFTGFGVKFGGIGDAVLHSEFEAPGNDAICAMQSRGGQLGLGATIVSLASGSVVKTVFGYDPAYNAGMRLGPWFLIRAGSGATQAQFGDFVTTPAASGTATAVGTATLTDTTKTWKRNQFKGGAIKITSGTGVDTWAEIASNTKDTITITSSSWAGVGTAPIIGSGYALDYACKAVSSAGVPTGAGHMSSHNLTLPDCAIIDASFEKVATNEITVGSSNDAKRLVQHLSVTATLDFASVAANAVGTSLTVTVRGAAVGDEVVVTPPAAAAAQGVVYNGAVTGADTVTVYPKNVTTGAIDPASGTFRVSVRQFA